MERGVKTILIDVDDCLLPTNGRVSSAYFVGLRKVADLIEKANHGTFPPIGWCSGRDRNYIEAVSFFAGLPNSWSVIESGIALFNPTTKELLLNPDLTPEVRTAFEEITQLRVPQVLAKHPELFFYPGNVINVAFELRHGCTLPIEECYEAVRQEVADLLSAGLVTVHHSRIAVDISPAGIDKASGIRFLSDYTRIHPDSMLGIGDSHGDFPMMNLVGSVGCPANASSACKALVASKGGYISPFDYAEGVADVIGHFVQKS